MAKDDVKVLIEETLRELGIFSDAEIVAARSREDGFVGERDGIKYFRNFDYRDFHTKGTVNISDQQGEGTSRPDRRR